jgi:hypothetical protein
VTVNRSSTPPLGGLVFTEPLLFVEIQTIPAQRATCGGGNRNHVWAGSVSDGTHLRPCGDRMIFGDFCTPGDPPAYDLSSIALEGELLRIAYP